jgi:hypothetical protein
VKNLAQPIAVFHQKTAAVLQVPRHQDQSKLLFHMGA